jgi:hypothetical protein
MTVSDLSDPTPCHGLTPWGTLVAADVNGSLLKFRTGGVFSLTLRLAPLDAEAMLSCPYELEDSGSYLFRFSRAARGPDATGRISRRSPRLDDAKGRRLAKSHRIELGSVVRVSFGFSSDAAATSLEYYGLQTKDNERARRKS